MKDFETCLKEIGEVGYVEQTRDSLAYISGLPNAAPFELVVLESGEIAQVTLLHADLVEVLLFSKTKVKIGTKVARSGESLSLPVGEELLGQTIDPLGFPLDKTKVVRKPKASRPIDIAPTGIEKRKLITKACETGVTIVDLIVPLGQGQRELVIGDRKTGKTEFALQALFSQAKLGSVCIFASIGQSVLHVKHLEEYLTKHNIAKHTILVASSSSDPAGMIFLTPYSAMTIAEFFRDQGRDVIVVFDDLTTHAKFYREIALLGRRFPGRNSYPSDVFSTHARLLERGGNFVVGKGEASITCLVIVETVLSDITGYIQTNLMSITDGHIYLDTDLFYRGRRPAIHPFLSVTRLGRQTQGKIAKDIYREVMAALTLFEKTQRFARFGAELSEGSRLALRIGQFLLAFFEQSHEAVFPLPVQLASFAMLWNGFWREKGVAGMKSDIGKLNTLYQTNEKVKRKVDSLIRTSASLNELLGVIGKAQNLWQT